MFDHRYDYAKRIFNFVTTRHPQSKKIVCVNDYYGDDVINTKDCEHLKRKRYIGGEAPNVYPSSAKKLPLKNDLNRFFKNKANKIRLQEYLQQQFKEFVSDDVKLVYSVRNKCCEITQNGEVFLNILATASYS